MKTFDVIVLGVGGMGSAAAAYLAKRKKRVLAIERFNIPHNMGSSHGQARIFRLSQFNGSVYVPLAVRSLELWKEIENLSKEKLFYQTGGIDAGTANGAFFQTAVKSCTDHSLVHEILDPAALKARFPAFELPSNYLALWQPDAGFLVPEKCITELVNLAFYEGAEIHAREEVLDWKPLSSGVELRTSRDVYHAGNLVVTAGAWTSKFLPLLKELLVVERAAAIWFQPQQPDLFRLNNLPVFIIEDAGNGCYGFPMFGHPGFRVGTFRDPGTIIEPDAVERSISSNDEERIRYYVEKFLPRGAGEAVAAETCLYTNSPDENFIIDRHPEFPQISFACGFSGYGFKFCTAIGEIMADLASGTQTRQDISTFSLSRFRNTSLQN